MRTILLALLLSLPAHGMSRGAPAPTPSATPSSIASPGPSPSVMPAGPGHIGFSCVECNAEEKIKVAAAELRANKVVQAPCFEKFMLGWGLLWTNDKTPAQVVAEIRAARLTVPVHYYYENSSTVGYRNTDKPDLYFNRRFHVFYDVNETASNGAHEWSHVLGYDHPVRRKSWRGRTVPYAINHAFEDIEGCKGLQ